MGLVEYGSDDSDSEVTPQPLPVTSAAAVLENLPARTVSPVSHPKPTVKKPSPTPPSAAPRSPSPVVGPTLPPPDSPSPQQSNGASDETPLSPYTQTRNEIHSLTLPPSIPDIPPSPPGSPSQSLAQKFANFRRLKAQGVHFNEKLVRSSALRNPNLLEKLTSYVGFEPSDQYSTNLPSELWNPDGFSKEGFAEELAKAQAEIGAELREREAKEGKEKVEFVGATMPEPSITVPVSRDARLSAAERVMKGLDRERKSATPPIGGKEDGKRNGRREERDGREKRDTRRDDRRDERRGEGRERKRRRSRSRSRSRDRDRDRDRRYRDYEYRERR